MELSLNILLLLCLLCYGIMDQTQSSVKRICGLRDAGSECRNFDLSIYSGEKKSLEKPLKIEFTGTNGNHQHTLDMIEKINEPFTLVLFDSHFDAKPKRNKIHCGNWIDFALGKDSYMKRVVAIGVSKGIKFEMAPCWCNYDFIKTGKYVVFPALGYESYFKDSEIPAAVYASSKKCEFDYISQFLGSPGYYVRWNTPSYRGVKGFIETGSNVYISIDLDVLKGVKTPYGSGRMETGAVCDLIKNLGRDCKIVGVDICGTDDVSSKTAFEEILKCLWKV